MLDDAMDGLKRRDREAIVMRFFEGKSMQEVGTVYGISENAAKKRVYHGLEKLRKFFSKRGVALSSSIIAGAITSHSVQAAPTGLLTKLAAATATGGKASALVAGTLKLMLWEKLKWMFACGASAAVVVGAIPIASSVLAKNEPKTGTVHLEGTALQYNVNENGTTNFGTATNYGLLHFDLWRNGSQWAIRLISNTNMPGGESMETFDGTNIYVCADASGTHGWGQNLVPFHHAATIYPGIIKIFNFVTQPLWWGYCSSVAEAGSGSVPDFTGPGDFQRQETPRQMAFIRVSNTNVAHRVGPPEMTLYQALDSGGFSTNRHCDIIPTEEKKIGGTTVVTKCDMRIFRWSLGDSKELPKVLYGYIVNVDKVNLDASAPPFVPQMQGMTLIDDYRTARFWEEYVSDHWIDPGETTRHSPLPVVLGPMGKDVNDMRNYVAQPSEPHLVGKNGPVFKAKTITGQTLDFPGDYRGKLVFLDFWATWCGPCVAELPNVTAAYEKFSSRGVEFLGVSLDKKETVPKLGDFCQAHKMAWPEICDGQEWSAAIAKLYSVEAIPMSFLIDGDTGQVLLEGDSLRGDKLIPALEQALKNKKRLCVNPLSLSNCMDSAQFGFFHNETRNRVF